MATAKIIDERLTELVIQRKSSKKTDPYVLLTALDFGTTFSGYAFSFKTSQDDIHMNRNWGESLGHASYKTPTSVLTGPDHKFEAFGHEAEDRYNQIIEDTKKKEYHMYRHFKMLLHRNAGLSRTSQITSEAGHMRPAMDIFVMAIKFLKDHLLKRITEMVDSKPDESLIRWVLTVPAIWTEGAKQFMREAAFNAGCIKSKDSEQLIIALEPEAASLYCRRLDIKGFVVRDDVNLLTFQPGTKYLVIDAGGGTVDITAHEVLESEDIKELNVANGGAWGGIEVDKKFLAILEEVFGKDFMLSFQTENPSQFLTIMTQFEKSKKSINLSDENSRINIQISWAMGSKYSKFTGKEVEAGINEKGVKGVTFHNGALMIDHETSVELFKDVVGKITAHITQLLKSANLTDLSYVMLVGGFGESKILQQYLKEIMPANIKMIVPAEAQLAVIKGAVYFGYHKNEIKSRIARKTYGTDTMRCFDEKIHEAKRKRVLGQEQEWCDDIFQPFVIKGETIESGDVIERRRTPVYDKQPGMTVDIFCTDKDGLDQVEYVDKPYMERLGGIYVEMPDIEKNFNRVVMVQFSFGGTEIKVTATDSTSGSSAETKMDFLSEY